MAVCMAPALAPVVAIIETSAACFHVKGELSLCFMEGSSPCSPLCSIMNRPSCSTHLICLPAPAAQSTWLLQRKKAREVPFPGVALFHFHLAPSKPFNAKMPSFMEAYETWHTCSSSSPCTYDLYGSVLSLRAWLRFQDENVSR